MNKKEKIDINDAEYSPLIPPVIHFHPYWTPRELAPPLPAQTVLADQTATCPPHLVDVQQVGLMQYETCKKCGTLVRQRRLKTKLT